MTSDGLRRTKALELFKSKRDTLRRAYPSDNDGDELAPASASASSAPANVDIDDDGDGLPPRLRRMPPSMMKR